MPTPQDMGSATGRQSGRQTQTPKGIVKVGIDKGWLRLRWTYLGKRYALTLGLPNSTANRTFAQQKVHQIELDIVSGHFDPTLKRYKSEAVLKRSLVSAVELFQQFTEEKSRSIYHRTLEKYETTINYLTQYFKDKPAEYVGVSTAEQFVEWLKERNDGRVLKERLGLLKACWDWGLKKGVVELNPWKELVSRVKVAPKQMPRPFTIVSTGSLALVVIPNFTMMHRSQGIRFRNSSSLHPAVDNPVIAALHPAGNFTL